MRRQRRNWRIPAADSLLPEETQEMDSSTVQSLIQQGMPEAKGEVHGPDGVHFEALVVSPAFAGKLPLARHRMVYATLGEGVGGCTILGGRIWRGASGYAGEFGYFPINSDGVRLEEVASSANIIRRVRERFHQDSTSSLVEIGGTEHAQTRDG